jgi:hypothetical protein
MKKIFFLASIFVFINCQNSNTAKLVTKFELPKKLKEISGLTMAENQKTIWCIEDSGNENEISLIDSLGNITKSIVIENAENIDWEDITKDKDGNLYIGDFGNNDNDRQDLSIHKINKNDLSKTTVATIQKTTFSYNEQKDFPAKKNNKLFDVESFFEFDNYFYLITKNRNKKFDGRTLVYKIANANGTQTADLIRKINTGTSFENGAITSAAISDDQTKVVLLTHSKIILFEDFGMKPFFEGTRSDIELNHISQKESICFKNNNTVLVADEQDKKTGGVVYEIKLF